MGQIKILFKVKNGRLSFFIKKKKRKKWKTYKRKNIKKGATTVKEMGNLSYNN
jgi:hypothetical protein